MISKVNYAFGDTRSMFWIKTNTHELGVPKKRNRFQTVNNVLIMQRLRFWTHCTSILYLYTPVFSIESEVRLKGPGSTCHGHVILTVQKRESNVVQANNVSAVSFNNRTGVCDSDTRIYIIFVACMCMSEVNIII